MTEEELNAARKIHAKIVRLRDQLGDLRKTGGLRATGKEISVQCAGGVGVCQICAELEDEITGLEKQWEIERAILRRALEKAPLDETGRKLMLLRYVECKPWREIGLLIGYTERQTYRIHQAAIKMSVDVS